jgi:hypothetical protein
MVMTEWMSEVKKALGTIPKGTPKRLETAIKKAKLTYKGPSSSHHAAASHSMKKSHKRRRGRSGKSRKGMRKSHNRSRKHYKGGMSKLSPSNYDDGKGVGTSGVGVQIDATTRST